MATGIVSPMSSTLFEQDPTGLTVRGRFVEVALPTPVDRQFDYAVPEPLAAQARVGHRVNVPFGKRTLLGIVTAEKTESTLMPHQVREILSAPDTEPLVNEGMLRLTRWMAEYYACSWGEALQAALPAVVRTGRKRRTRTVLRLAQPLQATLLHVAELESKAATAASKKPGGGDRTLGYGRVLRALVTFVDTEFSPLELAEKLGLSQAPLNTLRKQGWLRFERVEIRTEFTGGARGAEAAPAHLTPEQHKALASVSAALARDEYKAFLLFGVTGSGKTEVYIRAMEQALALGKSAIVLVPEIALTPQTTRRFASRFDNVCVLHSGMTDGQRREAWKSIAEGKSRVVVGPRSALFAPVKDLGLVVVDEEHEGTYKQDNTPRYHARDTAIVRGRFEHAVVILGSATPSLESWHNAQTGKYDLLELKSRVAFGRAGAAPALPPQGQGLAAVEIIDMGQECREQQAFTFFSRRLRGACAQALADGQQAIIFLNRRGYHTFLSCRNCGQTMMCPHCAIPMSFHRGLKKMACHYCLETADLPRQCPSCLGGPVKLMGMGTERLEEELKDIFAGHAIARMDSDVMKTRDDYESTLDAFRAGETRILVGTQMIAKGLDFPNVTVVGVVSADTGMGLSDFRSYERAFQLITQVSGRAGRGAKPGTVVVQTFQPQHMAILTAARQDYRAFVDYELPHRQQSHYPPFSRLVLVTIEARDLRRAQEEAARLAAAAQDFSRQHKDTIFAVTPPFEAAIARLRGKHRQQVLVKAQSFQAVRGVINAMRPMVKSQERLRVSIDVDPIDML